MQVYVRLRSASREYEWRHGVLVRRDESDATTRVAVVQLEDGQLIEANEEQDVLMANTNAGAEAGGNRVSLADIDSLDALTHLHEASFVDYLKERYAVDQVYCRSGSLLIAVNPFKDLPGMYDMPAYSARLEAMRQSEKKEDAQLPPHVFSMAESAYQSLRRRRRLSSEAKKNQTILVSGESGAGKTESTKFIMQYLAEVSTPVDVKGSDAASVPDLTKFLLSANPILESFGNARTLRNNNSSRFGKFVRMFFNEPKSASQHLQMVRSTVETYLLERVRVVHQGLGERNFHVFYELLKGASPEMRKDLLLIDLQAKDFQYVNVGRCYERSDRVSDAQQFTKVLEAMQVIGFSPAEQLCIWKIVSALLHLGNAGFIPTTGHEDDDPANAPPCIPADSSASKYSSREHLAMASQLLSIAEVELLSSLTVRTIYVSGETYQVKLSQAQCCDTRDAAARSLYGWVFQYLVKRINDTSPDQPNATTNTGEEKGDQQPCISVLDIFGFEEFDVNQFEQFCINYANEKLQYQFIKDILESEQNAHIQEGVKWDPVDYQDNALCLEMIEQKPSGIFSLLDEECLMPKGTDASFARKMYLQMKQHPSFLASSKDQVDFAFQVSHYAGQIKYMTTGFCEKNKDQPSIELLNLLKTTDDDDLKIMVTAFEENDTPIKTQQERPKIRRRSSVIGSVGIGSQFKQQLANLVEVVQQTQTHYIRCIKPNDQNTSGEFDLGKVARQLRYGGVLKAIEIMRQSYPVRMPHLEFRARYSVLVRKRRRDSPEIGCLVKQLSSIGAEVGKTRVFIRQEVFDELERKRDHLLTGSVIRIQAKWRSVGQRRRYCRTLFVLRSIQLRWKAIYLRKCLVRTRHRAATLIQCQLRAWHSIRLRHRIEAVAIIQRAFRVWRSMKVQHPSEYTSAPRSVPPEAGDAEVDVGFPRSKNKLKDQEPIRWSTMSTDDWRSTAGDSESSWTSEHPSFRNSYSIPTPPPSMDPPVSAGDQDMLQRALGELERLRLRAAAAEAALAQMSGGRAALPSSVLPTYMDQLSSFPPRPIPAFKVDAFGGTTLHTLVEHGSPEEVYGFLSTLPSGVDLLNRPENQRGYTPLHIAVRRGCVDVVGIFFRPDVLPHVNINAADRDGNTALHIATQLNDELADRLMELLLCFGADVNSTNYLKQTALHLCAMVQREGTVGAELVGKLLRNGADPTVADLMKRTPLHYAVDKGLDAVSIALVKGGADMNIPDGEGQRVVTHPKGTHLLRYLRVTPSWIPDADIMSCMICQEPFSFFFGRKCHCDRCGRVCCSECCPSSSNWNGRFCFDCKHYQRISM